MTMNKIPYETRHSCNTCNKQWCKCHHIPRYKYPDKCDKTIDDFRTEWENGKTMHKL